MTPLILSIDTTTRVGNIALSRGGELLNEISCLVPGYHTDWLLQGVERSLADCQFELNQLDAIAVVRGPGAFTGLRVGLATAKGLALGLDLPMLGISSLQALAASLPRSGTVCALLDARKQEVYAGVYQCEIFPPQPLGDERVVSPEDLLASLSGEVLFVGDGAVAYHELIAQKFTGRARFVEPFENRTRPAAIAALAFAAWQRGEGCSADQLNPVYIRASEAEIAWALKSATAVIQG